MVVAGAHVAVTEKNMQKVEGDVIEQFLRIMKSVGKHGTTWVKVPSNTVIRNITEGKTNPITNHECDDSVQRFVIICCDIEITTFCCTKVEVNRGTLATLKFNQNGAQVFEF